jgi:hypothetical protein
LYLSPLVRVASIERPFGLNTTSWIEPGAVSTVEMSWL